MTKRKRNFVKVGTIRIPWCKLGDGRTCIDMRSLKLGRETFVDHQAAVDRATEIARNRHNAGAGAGIHTIEDHAAFSDLARAAGQLGVKTAALIDAGVHALRKPIYLVPEIVTELLRSKDAHDLNKRYRRCLTDDLEAFAKQFSGDITAIIPKDVETFLQAFQVGVRRRNSLRDNVCHLFAFAKQRNYLPADRTSAAHQVQRVSPPPTLVEFFAVWEMELFLEHAREQFVPWLVLNAFSGARLEEIIRARDAAEKKDPIRWEDFDWDDRAIAMRPETSKTGRARRIPILDNLYAILRPWRDRKSRGPVSAVHPGDYETRRMVKQANRELARNSDTRRIVWRKNALRHSYGSYRMAIIQNEHQLAYEMGNSIEMIRAHYHNPRPKSEAAAWFNLERAAPGNIIQVELFG